MKLAVARVGEPLLMKGRELEFSFHPMTRTNRRWGIHSMLYAADPWAVIAGSVNESIGPINERAAATSFVRQAREYFTAAERASSIETRPLLYYYSFLNLAKAIAMAKGRSGMVGKVSHGVAVVGGRAHAPNTAILQMESSTTNGKKSAVDELHWALEGSALPVGHYTVNDIVAQSVIGHRMWREAFSQPRVERFIPVEAIRFLHDPAANQIWLNILLRRDVLRARSRGLTETLRESGLEANFRGVVDSGADLVSQFHVLEQIVPTAYSGRAADVVVDTVESIRTQLWQTVTAAPPYRRFYLYLAPLNDRRMPQWLSTYSTLFWLGSLTRYQPVELFDALDGNYGPFFREFLETQPKQLLYILASYAKSQNVTRAGIV
ncbi:YaaC family protein [Arthrobacter sp. UYCu712]|uniref:YaaC family protein n=1 Tax=Arthrobacter sp. UYCu712 TaxID=3156340 RepID=UPI00339107DC